MGDEQHTLTPGTRVRFLGDQLGTIDPTAARIAFTEHTVGLGDEGEVISYPGTMPSGWLAVRPDAFPEEYVPVHPDMVEAVASA